MLEWVLAESIQANTRIKEQASLKSGGAGGRGVASIAYSYYVFTEYIYPYGVISCGGIMWNLFTKMVS